MKSVNMHEAKSSLSRLVREISTGIEVDGSVIDILRGSPRASNSMSNQAKA